MTGAANGARNSVEDGASADGMPAADVAAPAFTVRVPPSWFRFDVWRATRTGDLGRIVDARLTARPGLRRHRAALLRLLREVADDAQRRGALLCAVTVDPMGDAGTVLASLMVFRTAGDPDRPDAGVDEIAASLTAHEGGDGPGTWRRIGIVEVPAGRAVRVTGVGRLTAGAGLTPDGPDGPDRADDTGPDDAAADDARTDGARPDGAPHVVSMHTLLPVPGGGVLDVVLTSPQTQISDALLDLFDAVSGTFAWVQEPVEDPAPDPVG